MKRQIFQLIALIGLFKLTAAEVKQASLCELLSRKTSDLLVRTSGKLVGGFHGGVLWDQACSQGIALATLSTAQLRENKRLSVDVGKYDDFLVLLNMRPSKLAEAQVGVTIEGRFLSVPGNRKRLLVERVVEIEKSGSTQR